VMSQKIIEDDDVRWVPAILQNGAPFKSAPFSKWHGGKSSLPHSA
jgi:hypothetical protein